MKIGDRVKLSKKKYTMSGIGTYGINEDEICKRFDVEDTVIHVHNKITVVTRNGGYFYWPIAWFDKLEEQMEFEF